MPVQVDMFEVQLGAALLLQFKDDTDVVTVLADAGRKTYKVVSKLGNAFADFENPTRRLDLIVGTHYDGDHLAGLVDVVADNTIVIGEVWLPPVVNEVEQARNHVNSPEGSLLAHQLGSDEGPEIFARYLSARRDTCELAQRVLREIDRKDGDHAERRFREPLREAERGETSRAFFESQVVSANAELAAAASSVGDRGRWIGPEVDSGSPGEETHADHPIENPSALYRYTSLGPLTSPLPQGAIEMLRADRLASAQYRTELALIQKSAAKDAITAIYLNEVVEALKKRTQKPAVRSRLIPDGQPVIYDWDRKSRTFQAGKAARTSLSLLLLGPSEGLAQRYADLLPRGDYATLAFKTIPYKRTTESNELSYVMKFTFEDQNILVAGDAACVDFKDPATSNYYPALVGGLGPLDIIQVAHHGGANGFFYEALLNSPFKAQASPAYLLLSHETGGSSRPSPEFTDFVIQSGKSPASLSLVFTAQPRKANVTGVLSHFHAPVPAHLKTQKGDARLTFDGRSWDVPRHAVSPP